MDRLNRILSNTWFREYYLKIETAEADRRFCRHDMHHFLAVARLAMIFNLQEKLGIDKEMIYAAALLHDIGRFIQYEDGTPHEQASAVLCVDILKQVDFDEKEIMAIVTAIGNHRNSLVIGNKDLSDILYRADKMSRDCFACHMYAECNWKDGKKNQNLQY